MRYTNVLLVTIVVIISYFAILAAYDLIRKYRHKRININYDFKIAYFIKAMEYRGKLKNILLRYVIIFLLWQNIRYLTNNTPDFYLEFLGVYNANRDILNLMIIAIFTTFLNYWITKTIRESEAKTTQKKAMSLIAGDLDRIISNYNMLRKIESINSQCMKMYLKQNKKIHCQVSRWEEHFSFLPDDLHKHYEKIALAYEYAFRYNNDSDFKSVKDLVKNYESIFTSSKSIFNNNLPEILSLFSTSNIKAKENAIWNSYYEKLKKEYKLAKFNFYEIEIKLFEVVRNGMNLTSREIEQEVYNQLIFEENKSDKRFFEKINLLSSTWKYYKNYDEADIKKIIRTVAMSSDKVNLVWDEYFVSDERR